MWLERGVSGMGRSLKDEENGRIVGKYEIGRMIGIGTFAKVSIARNVDTGEEVAIKVINKKLIEKYQIAELIKKEISTMHLIKHPNVIRIHEAIASKKKIYIVLELATGGELFDTITSRQKMKEDDARHYFQQLVTAVDFCHSRGIYHRDLKPENLLLDSNGVLKVTDFGLSALPHQLQVDGLLHTRCGSPNYVAPEVINNARRGYDGAKSDLWSCGVILFVLLAGYLPFDDTNMFMLFKKIGQADFTCPGWITKSAQKLIKRILNPNPDTRITMVELFKNSWFRKGYKSPIFEETPLDVVHDIFDESLMDEKPPMMNAFHIIAGFGCFDLRKLFENLLDCVEKETRFISKLPPEEVVSMIKMAVKPLGFRVVKNKKYKMKLLGGKVLHKGQLAITTEIYELFPSLSLVEVFKSKGDTVEFHKDFMVSLKDAVWTLEQENNHDTSQTSNCSSIYE